MAEDHARCLASGMDDFLSKPVQLQDVAEMLRRWLPPQEGEANRVEMPARVA
jgi:CheY-like chemotaxis protein